MTGRNGRSSWERQGIVAFCTCQWNRMELFRFHSASRAVSQKTFSLKRSIFNKIIDCNFICSMLLCHFTFLCLIDPIFIHYAQQQIAKIFCLEVWPPMMYPIMHYNTQHKSSIFGTNDHSMQCLNCLKNNCTCVSMQDPRCSKVWKLLRRGGGDSLYISVWKGPSQY
jgi:hypothetical protein